MKRAGKILLQNKNGRESSIQHSENEEIAAGHAKLKLTKKKHNGM